MDGDLLTGLGFSRSIPSLIVRWCLGLRETRLKALEFRFADQGWSVQKILFSPMATQWQRFRVSAHTLRSAVPSAIGHMTDP